LLKHIDADKEVIAASHVSAFLSIGVLAAYAWSLQFLEFSSGQIWWLSNAFILALYGNWLGNFIRAHYFVSALEPKGDLANIIFFTVFNLFIGLPALIAAVGWLWGLYRKTN
jgi:hypothetical protein